jgi:glycosyltransferase involved in cell wall biosynthesis
MSGGRISSVSVVIPCYNYGHFLEDAVASVLDDQPGVDVRVLVIDDASPDGSGEIARKIAARDPRVEAVVHPVNAGHIATYNEGLLEWADGDYCVLMSADDRLTPGALRRAVDLLDAHPNVGFVYGYPLWFVDGTPLPRARTMPRGWSVWPGRWWLERRFRAGCNNITSPEVVVRTSLQQRVGGYDPRLPHTGDLEMWLRLAANADVGFLRGVDQAYHRTHQKNMMTSYNALKDLQQRRLAYQTVLDRYRDTLPDVPGLADSMRRKLGREALWAAAREYDRGGARQAPVGDLVTFAFDCRPDAKRLPVYWTLQLRKRIGPDVMPRLRPVIVSAFASKAAGWLRRRSWKWRGY